MPSPTPPTAERRPHVREHHGDRVEDPYAWMRDLEDPALLAHLEAENAYAEARTEHLAPLRSAIVEEIRSRVKETDLSVPVASGPWWYYSRTVEGRQYAAQVPSAAHRPRRAPGPRGGCRARGAGRRRRQRRGRRQRVLLARRAHRQRRPPARRVRRRHRGRRALRPDDPRHRDRRGARHLGHRHRLRRRAEPRRAVRLLHPARRRVAPAPAVAAPGRRRPGRRRARAPGGRRAVLDGRVASSRDERWLLLGLGSKTTSEVHVLDADDPRGQWRVLAPRREGVEYDVEPAADRFLIVHNTDTPDADLAWAPFDATSREQWVPWLRSGEGERFVAVDAFDDATVLSLRTGGLTALRVLPRDPRRALGARRAVGRRRRPAGALDRPRRQPRAGPARHPGRRRVVGHPAHRARRRPRHPRAHAAQAPAGARRLRRRELRRAPGVGHGIRRHPGAGLGGAPRRRSSRTAPTPVWSRPTAPTRSPPTRTSRSRGSACSTAASSTPSPTCAAAARWAGAGTTTASCSPRPTPSPTPSPASTTSSASGWVAA